MKVPWNRYSGIPRSKLKRFSAMRIRFLLIVFLAFMMGSCSSPHYLPQADEVHLNQYGSYIKVKMRTASVVRGELIALDKEKLVVLTSSNRKCVTLPVSEMKSFSLSYAQPKHYGWTIPLFTLVTLTHGMLAALTLPLNLAVTIAVTATGESDFKFNNKNITLHKLKMFARFPQGIPENVDVASIQ